jgi:hypothetical protein
MKRRLTRLFGGHRNKVYKTNGFVKVVWKDGFKRKKQIRAGVLLENFVAAHTDIKARLLVDKSRPIQEENGKLVTYFHYSEGEIRYPWNPAEIASAAKLLGRLHSFFPRGQKVQPLRTQRLDLIDPHRLHLDFARGNILFQPQTSAAVGAIDFETTAPGPVEQELGRTLSFILVDSPINYDRDDPSRSILKGSSLFERLNMFLTNYPFPYRKDDVIEWTKKYLVEEDYGSLNEVRNKVMQWLTLIEA